MRVMLAAAIAAASLAGCMGAGPEQFAASCQGYGIGPDSPYWAMCMQNEAQIAAIERQAFRDRAAALSNTFLSQPGALGYNPPPPTICNPTMAGSLNSGFVCF